MSRPELEVSLYTLHVDARDAVAAVLDAGIYTAGSHALMTVLGAAAPGVTLSAQAGQDDATIRLMPTAVSTVDDALTALASAGLLAGRTVWNETSAEAYLSDGRALTVVRVSSPFTASTHDGETPNRARQLPPVSAGWYLIGVVGGTVRSLVGVASIPFEYLAWTADIGDLAERLTSWAAEMEGFGASRCDAQCSTCQRRWYAEAGAWRFHSESGGPGWDYDDAYGFDGITIVCPLCTVGRVAFAIS